MEKTFAIFLSVMNECYFEVNLMVLLSCSISNVI